MILLLLLISQEYDYEDLFNKATTLLVQFQTEQDSAFDLLVTLGSDTLTADTTLVFLVSKFDTKSAIERHRLKDIFKSIGTSTIPNIVKHIDYRGSDEEARSLKQSLWVLGEIGSEQIVEPVAQFINDRDWRIRSSAHTALGKSKSLSALPYTVTGCSDSINIVRKSAFYALSSVCSDTLLKEVYQGLEDAFYGVRFASVTGLVKSADSLAIEKHIGQDMARDYYLIRALIELKLDEHKIMRFAEHREARVRMLVYKYSTDIELLKTFLDHEEVPMMQNVIRKRLEELVTMSREDTH